MVDCFTDSLCDRSHCNDNAVGVFSSVIVEESVFTSGDFADFVHVVFHNSRYGGVVVVARLAVLEEDIGVFGRASSNRFVGVHGAATELCQRIHIDERTQVFHVHCLDLLNLVRCAEAVEEIHERNSALDSAQVSHTGEVHNLLNRAFAEHGESCLACSHYVLMVAEDAQCVRCQSSCRDVEHARKELACNLVHVGNHQQESLRRCVGGGESSGLQRAVNRTGGTCFALHFLNCYGFTENVFSACGGPFIYVLGHCRGRGDGVDGCDFSEHVADVSRGLVAIAGHEFFLFTHKKINNYD